MVSIRDAVPVESVRLFFDSQEYQSDEKGQSAMSRLQPNNVRRHALQRPMGYKDGRLRSFRSRLDKLALENNTAQD